MEESILDYIKTNCSIELSKQLFKSLTLFDSFGVNTYSSEFINILSSENYSSSDDIFDSFIEIFHITLDNILFDNGITIEEEITITYKNEILSSIYRLQDLDSYDYVHNCLESEFSNIIIFSNIIKEYCSLSDTQILKSVKSLDDNFLLNMKSFVYSNNLTKETLDVLDTKKSILLNFECMAELYGEDIPGYILYTNGMLSGSSINIYLSFIKDELIVEDSLEKTALNILSVIYLTEKSLINPIEVYRSMSFELFQDNDMCLKIENILSNIHKKINMYVNKKRNGS